MDRPLTERQLLDRDIAALIVGAPLVLCWLCVTGVVGWWNDRKADARG